MATAKDRQKAGIDAARARRNARKAGESISPPPIAVACPHCRQELDARAAVRLARSARQVEKDTVRGSLIQR